MIRTVWLLLAGLVITVVLSTRVLLATYLRSRRITGVCDRVSRFWCRALLRMGGARVRFQGLERLDWSEPMVIVANHQSWFDVFALGAHLPANRRFVGKEELARIPIFGPAWLACGHIAIDRSDRERAIESLEKAADRAREERLALVFFAEGTRSWDGRLQPFKKGAFVFAIQAGLPVVPLGISGSRAIMKKGSFRVRPGEIRVRVGRPISVDGLEHEDRDRLLEEARSAVAALMEDPDGVTGQPGGAATATEDGRKGEQGRDGTDRSSTYTTGDWKEMTR